MDLSVPVLGDEDAAAVGQRFETGGEIHTVAEYVLVVDDDVAECDANAETESLVVGLILLVLGDTGLPRQGTLAGINHAGELTEEPVAKGLDDAPPVVSDQRLDQVLAKLHQSVMSGVLVESHQTTEPHQVGLQYRR